MYNKLNLLIKCIYTFYIGLSSPELTHQESKFIRPSLNDERKVYHMMWCYGTIYI